MFCARDVDSTGGGLLYFQGRRQNAFVGWTPRRVFLFAEGFPLNRQKMLVLKWTDGRVKWAALSLQIRFWFGLDGGLAVHEWDLVEEAFWRVW